MPTKLTPKETKLTKGVTTKVAPKVYVTFPEDPDRNRVDRFGRPGDSLKAYANSTSFKGTAEVKKAQKDLNKAKSNVNYLCNSVAHQNALSYSGNHTKSFIPKAIEDTKKKQVIDLLLFLDYNTIFDTGFKRLQSCTKMQPKKEMQPIDNSELVSRLILCHYSPK